MQTAILEPDNRDQATAVIRDAVAELGGGGLVVFPTETVYGIAGIAGHAQAMGPLRRFKSQPEGGFAVHASAPAITRRYIDAPSPHVRRIIEKLLALPITLRVELGRGLSLVEGIGARPAQRRAIVTDETIALRCPDNPLAKELLGMTESIVVATAAAPRGGALPINAQQAAESVAGVAQYLIDGGPTRHGKPSTAVRLKMRNGSPVVGVDREGVIDTRTVEKAARYTVLLVCTGNTCRSPMAEVLTRQALAERLGIAADELTAAGFAVASAGVFAAPGAPASPEAVDAMGAIGLDLSRHRSTPISRQLIEDADLILGMSESHVQAVRETVPSAADRVLRLDAGADIADPIGLDLDAYQRTADQITQGIEARLKEQLS